MTALSTRKITSASLKSDYTFLAITLSIVGLENAAAPAVAA
jgi:hypothetical protein